MRVSYPGKARIRWWQWRRRRTEARMDAAYLACAMTPCSLIGTCTQDGGCGIVRAERERNR